MKVWLILVLLCTPLFAQTAPKRAPAKKAAAAKKDEAAPSKWPVESLTVEGNHNYSREQVLAVVGLKVGQLAGKPEFEAARDRLTATGAFETVGGVEKRALVGVPRGEPLPERASRVA